MHPIACRVDEGCGDKHERVLVARVWFAAIKIRTRRLGSYVLGKMRIANHSDGG